jgi:hypothetical protein
MIADEHALDIDSAFAFSKHAVNRYRARCRPDLRLGLARQDLRKRVLDSGVISVTAPPWLHQTPAVRADTRTGANAYIIVDDEIALPLRFDDERGHGLPYVLTCLSRQWKPPAHPPTAATEWQRRRERAADLAQIIVFSPTCLRRYSQHSPPAVSAHTDLVELTWAGKLCDRAPEWTRLLPSRDHSPFYVDCGKLFLPLRLREPEGPFVATNCLWRDHELTPRQRGMRSRA